MKRVLSIELLGGHHDKSADNLYFLVYLSNTKYECSFAHPYVFV